MASLRNYCIDFAALQQFSQASPPLRQGFTKASKLALRRGAVYTQGMGPMLNALLDALIAIVIGLTVLVLAAGLVGLFRGGRPNLSNRLMRLRVALQFAAILLIALSAFWFGR